MRTVPLTPADEDGSASVRVEIRDQVPQGSAGIDDGIVVLDRVHSYGGAIARVAGRAGCADGCGG
ncbi:MAG: hypothetical protein H0V05_14915 [Euzebyaceae bacterium]|jgi:hypothetical protein|nr:hypothetical protein [Euzebyaceae bacterium]